MSKQAQYQRALRAIDERGALLVYPLANRSEPASLWSVLYPRSTMRWSWDSDADPRVAGIWHLREQLSRSRAVVYGKWYRGRATFFSRALFTAMLAARPARESQLSSDARDLLSALRDDSPQSSKELRRNAGLSGPHGERTYSRALRELWEGLWIVGMGEVSDGAFPSLAIGASQHLFEDLWDAAATGLDEARRALIARQLAPSSAFGRHWARLGARAPKLGASQPDLLRP